MTRYRFGNIRPEDQELAHSWAAEFGLDAILSTDGDSDRPLLTDETGTWLRGDVLGILYAQALRIGTIATPVSATRHWSCPDRSTRSAGPASAHPT